MVALVGRSGVGKTTVLELWLTYLQELGYRVGVVKHSHHPLPPDPPGKDSRRLGGGAWSLLATPTGMQLRGAVDWVAGVHWLAPSVDLVLLEGGKSSPFPKIEVVRGKPPLLEPSQLVATLGDPVSNLPHLDWQDPAGWTRFWLDLPV